MTNKWIVKEINNEKVKLLKEKFNLGNLVAKILSNRNILGREMQEDDIKKFLNPTRDDFYDPFLLPDMKQAVERIEQAINNNEKILIYGDYDADGITSTTILIKFFKEIGLEVDKYIPNRLEEGYGINNKALEEIKNSSEKQKDEIKAMISKLGDKVEADYQKIYDHLLNCNRRNG